MLLVWAAGLTVLAGLFAMTDSALSRVSAARALEMAREGVRGAGALHAAASDVARHLNLLLLLRLACELGATTLVAVVTIREWGVGWLAGAVTAGSRRRSCSGSAGYSVRWPGCSSSSATR